MHCNPMVFLFVFFISTVSTSGTNNSDNLTEKTVPHNNEGRQGRRLYHKVHSGLAFLTGVKIGTMLGGRGHDIGHGSLASSHSFHVFGKPVNTALSMSYGHNYHLPQVHEHDEMNQTRLEDSSVRLTLIEEQNGKPVGEQRNFDNKLSVMVQKSNYSNQNEFFKLHNQNIARLNNYHRQKQVKTN